MTIYFAYKLVTLFYSYFPRDGSNSLILQKIELLQTSNTQYITAKYICEKWTCFYFFL